MARSSTSFKPGQSGNPGGRPRKGPRAALRDVLLKPKRLNGAKLRLEEWAEEVIEAAKTPEDRLKIMQYIDPPRSDQNIWGATDDQAAKPRVEIPDEKAMTPGQELLLRGVREGRIKPNEVADLLDDAERAATMEAPK